MQAFKVGELRHQCSKLGLSSSGKKPDLIARLQSHQASSQEPPTPKAISPSGNIECLIGTSIAADVSDTIEMARDELQKAARNDRLQEEYLSHDRTVITNNHASFWTQMEVDLDQVKKEVASLQKTLQTKTDELERKNEDLRLATAELQQATAGFRDFRHRFISTYKRDILNEMDDADRKHIQHGNTVIHSGNIKCDAELYYGLNCRHDKMVFRKLYGVLPVIAATIDYEPTISLLNKHATIVSNPKFATTAAFHDRFQAFVNMLDTECYPDNYLNTNAPPTKEYYLFYDAVSKEVATTSS